MLPTTIRFPLRTAALALLLCVGAIPSSAQDAAQPAPAGDEAATSANSPEALATAARNILELIEVHQFRMRRIDASIAYYSELGDKDHVRQFSLLREREQAEYQQSLETYRRMLGDRDFTRVAGLLRNHLENKRDRPDERDASDVRERRDLAAQTEESAAERAERVRRMMAAQAAEERERASEQAAYDRSQAIARARASQRVQLAQRLQQARADQLEARAAAERRYLPPTLPGADGRPAVGARGASAPAGRAAAPAGAPGRATPPAGRPATPPRRP